MEWIRMVKALPERAAASGKMERQNPKRQPTLLADHLNTSIWVNTAIPTAIASMSTLGQIWAIG